VKNPPESRERIYCGAIENDYVDGAGGNGEKKIQMFE
jgi:hypothetical protein